MMKFLRRLFAGAAPESNAVQLSGEGRSRSVIEDRQPAIPGVIQVASADIIAQIFRDRCRATGNAIHAQLRVWRRD
jgi:hypothetical protein